MMPQYGDWGEVLRELPRKLRMDGTSPIGAIRGADLGFCLHRASVGNLQSLFRKSSTLRNERSLWARSTGDGTSRGGSCPTFGRLLVELLWKQVLGTAEGKDAERHRGGIRGRCTINGTFFFGRFKAQTGMEQKSPRKNLMMMKNLMRRKNRPRKRSKVIV